MTSPLLPGPRSWSYSVATPQMRGEMTPGPQGTATMFFFEYTQMDRAGTRAMHVLGIPSYVALMALIWSFPYGSLPGFLVASVGVLVYQFLYCKALYAFVHRFTPPRPPWQFALTVLCVQALVLAALYAMA